MESFVFGTSALGLAIPAFRFGGQGPRVFIMGGVHGNEVEGTALAYGLLNLWAEKFELSLQAVLVPAFNIDGVIKQTRLNGNGVDLNRNLPTRDWNPKAFDPKYPPGSSPCSESENKALVKFLDEFKPHFILTLHSWHPLVNVNGDCDPEAQVLAQLTGYEIKKEIGYPTPGCLGTYAGIERNWPTITYEIERGLALVKVLKIHLPAVTAALSVTAKERK